MLEWQDYGILLDGNGEPITLEDGSPMPIGKELQFNVQAKSQGGVVVASSDGNDEGDFDLLMFNDFQITVDQLEGEITLPYQIIRQVTQNPDTLEYTVQQTIQVPRSQLGGFAQFRLNYQYINRDEEEVYIGEDETPRVLVPRRPYIPPPTPPPVITVDEGQIKEALADKIYEKFFNSDLIQGSLEDIKSFQTTTSPTGVGYSTGRESDDEQLIFFKKDRNTPENQADFDGDGSDGIQAIAEDIRIIFENADDNSTIDLSELLDDEITIQENVSPDRISSADLDPPLYIEGTDLPLYYIENISYKLIYTHGETIIQVEFASFNRFFENNEGAQRYQEDGQDKPDQWLNKLNLSQLTKPKFGTRVDINKARNLLDTNIFELLPNQAIYLRKKLC